MKTATLVTLRLVHHVEEEPAAWDWPTLLDLPDCRHVTVVSIEPAATPSRPTCCPFHHGGGSPAASCGGDAPACHGCGDGGCP